MNDTGSGSKKYLSVFAIIDRKDKPSVWLKVGAAFQNRDGSTTLVLDAFPTGTNKLQIREPRAWDEPRPGNGKLEGVELEAQQ